MPFNVAPLARPFLLLLIRTFSNLFLVNFTGIGAVSLHSTSCDGNCIQEMERLIEATPTTSIGGILHTASNDHRSFMSHFFRGICDSYRDVDECMARCESRSKQVSELKSAYAGLQFVCKERREEFFASLPCLSENESKGVRKCSAQINQSQETTQLFTNSIASREFHSMQMRFSALCRDLSAVIRCMLPLINDNCGEKAANLLLKFIGLEFASFETLYQQLGFDTPLPVSCRTLIKHAMATDQQQIQKPFSRASAKIYKFYLNNSAASSKKFVDWHFPNLSLMFASSITLFPLLLI